MKNFIAGEYRKFSEYINGEMVQYDSFVPGFINKQFNCKDNEIYVLLSKADRLIGEINSFARLIPDIDVFIRMHVKAEAQKSSMIEGTHTEISEVILPEKAIKPEKRDEWKEVWNYINAINYATGILKRNNIPLNMRLINQTHKMLLRGVRGTEKRPGNIREKQNWIGSSDLLGKTSIKNANFIPPHHTLLPDLLSDLQKFWHNTQVKIPELIRIAISHYQFETIHPYDDGNGRIGRLIITLQLVEYGLLEKPMLYISDYFEKNKGNYFEYLTNVRVENKMEGWIKFFLKAVIAAAEKASNTFRQIIELRKVYDNKINDNFGSSAPLGCKLLLMMFSTPIMDKTGISKKLGVSYSVAARLIKRFLDQKMVVEYIPKGTRKRYYALWEYLDLFG